MTDETKSIDQVICNYTTNLRAFPPADDDLRDLHAALVSMYTVFRRAAETMGIARDEQVKVLERVQKTLWSFGQAGRLDRKKCATCLALVRLEFLSRLKFSRPEQTLSLLGMLGMPVEYMDGEAWSAEGKLKTSQQIHLRTPQAGALRALVARCAASSPKPKAAYERFLRVDPQAVLAGEKPALTLTPDAPAILANLPGPAADAWRELAGYLAGFKGYAPVVEFRSIHHGMWVATYNNVHGGRDLCGLTVQDGAMSVRMILYRAGHAYVQEHLDDFGPLVGEAFRRAHFYEDFGHQWLFVPVERVEDTVGVKKLLELMPVLLKEK